MTNLIVYIDTLQNNISKNPEMLPTTRIDITQSRVTSFKDIYTKSKHETTCCSCANTRAYHLEWWILNEDRFGELSIVLLRDVNAFPGQSLQDPAMILIVIVWIRIYVGQREAIQLRIGKRMDDLRLQMFLLLQASRFAVRTETADDYTIRAKNEKKRKK